MTSRLCYITASLCFLLIISGICQCAPLEKSRDKRDTRDLPSNLFKPLDGGSSNTEPRLAASQNTNSNDTPFQQSSDQNVVDQSSQDGVYRYPTRTQGSGSQNNMASHYNTYEDYYGNPFIYGVRSPNNLNPGATFTVQTYGSPVPLNYQRRPFPDNGDSNNYYRSESYSYNSDGNGPPQIEQSVYDSRLGHGTNVQRF